MPAEVAPVTSGRKWDGRLGWMQTSASQPQNAAEFACQLARAMGSSSAAAGPAGRVAIALLTADGDVAVRAAVAAGRELEDHQRWAVLRTLEMCRQRAQDEYQAAVPLLAQLRAAWAAKWGSEPPRQVA